MSSGPIVANVDHLEHPYQKHAASPPLSMAESEMDDGSE